MEMYKQNMTCNFLCTTQIKHLVYHKQGNQCISVSVISFNMSILIIEKQLFGD